MAKSFNDNATVRRTKHAVHFQYLQTRNATVNSVAVIVLLTRLRVGQTRSFVARTIRFSDWSDPGVKLG